MDTAHSSVCWGVGFCCWPSGISGLLLLAFWHKWPSGKYARSKTLVLLQFVQSSDFFCWMTYLEHWCQYLLNNASGICLPVPEPPPPGSRSPERTWDQTGCDIIPPPLWTDKHYLPATSLVGSNYTWTSTDSIYIYIYQHIKYVDSDFTVYVTCLCCYCYPLHNISYNNDIMCQILQMSVSYPPWIDPCHTIFKLK